jgi:hypothetical protein
MPVPSTTFQCNPAKKSTLDMRYAVGSKPGGRLDERPDAPPAGRKKSDLLRKHLHRVQMFAQKNKEYHGAAGDAALHPVKRVVWMSTAYVVISW